MPAQGSEQQQQQQAPVQSVAHTTVDDQVSSVQQYLTAQVNSGNFQAVVAAGQYLQSLGTPTFDSSNMEAILGTSDLRYQALEQLKEVFNPQVIPPVPVHVSSAPFAATVSAARPVQSVPAFAAVPLAASAAMPMHSAPESAMQAPVSVAPVAQQHAAVHGVGGASIKVPAPPYFHGNEAERNPTAVRHWLRNIELAIRQSKTADPVTLAVNYLRDTAADWRDIVFFRAHPVGAPIAWQTFVDEFMERFISRLSCRKALKAFGKISQQPGQSVQEYNFQFRQRREELTLLPKSLQPHVHLPPVDRQFEIWFGGLNASISAACLQNMTADNLDDLDATMQLAEDREITDDALKSLISKPSKSVHAETAKNVAQIQAGNGSGNRKKRKAAATQKQPSANQSPSQSRPSSGKAKIIPKPGISLPSQWPKEKLGNTKPFSDDFVAKLSHSAGFIKGPDGKQYSNKDMRLIHTRDCMKNDKCIGCLQPRGSHPEGQCPSPEVSFLHTHVSAADLTPTVQPTIGCEVAQADIGMNRDASVAPVPTHLAAVVSAQPYQGLTMLFAGSV